MQIAETIILICKIDTLCYSNNFLRFNALRYLPFDAINLSFDVMLTDRRSEIKMYHDIQEGWR